MSGLVYRRFVVCFLVVMGLSSHSLIAQSPDDLVHRYADLFAPEWSELAASLRQRIQAHEASSGADAFFLIDSLETEIDRHQGQVRRNIVRHLYAGQCYDYYTDADGTFRHFRSAVQLAEGLPRDDPTRALAYQVLGQYFVDENVFDLGIENLRTSLLAVAELLSPLESGPLDYPSRMHIIRAYSALGEADSVYAYHRRLAAFDTLRSEPHQIGYAYNNAGIFLRRAGDCKRALEVFRKGLGFTEGSSENNRLSYVNLLESRAHCLMDAGQSEQALADIQRAFRTRREFKRDHWAGQALGYLIKYYRELGQSQRAYALYREYEDYLSRVASDRMDHQTYRLNDELAQLLYEFGRDDRARYYENRYLGYVLERPELRTTGADRQPINSYLALRNRAFEQQREIDELQLSQLSSEVRDRNILLVLGGSLLVSCISLGVVFYGRRRERFRSQLAEREARERILQLENENLQLSVVAKEKDLGRLATDNQARTATKRDLLKRLRTLADLDPREREQKLHRLQRDLAAAIDDQETLSALQSNLTDVNAQFEERLRERVPKITPQEVRICGLVRLGMDDRQIAQLLQKSETAIRTARYRIRKKAGWTAGEMHRALGEV